MPIIIDIGAFKGQVVKRYLDLGYEVHAFEPNPNMEQYLEIFEDEATINYTAAWNEDGKANLHLMANPEPGEDGVSLIKEKINVGDRTIEVQTTNIGRYLRDLDEDIDILKINAEGAEYVIIESILKEFDPSRIKNWLVEDHQNYINSEKWTEHKNNILEKLSILGIEIKPWKL